MENMRVLPAGSYMGRVSGLASNTGGSMTGRGIRGNIAHSVALSGLRSAFRTSGLGSVTGDLACAGAAGASAINKNIDFSTGSKDWDNILNITTNAATAMATSYCGSKQQTTAPSVSAAGQGLTSPTTQMDASYQAQLAILNQQLQSNQLNMAQYQQQLALLQPKGMDTNTLLIAGGVGLAVIAAIFLLK